jgi:hypothetical protein
MARRFNYLPSVRRLLRVDTFERDKPLPCMRFWEDIHVCGSVLPVYVDDLGCMRIAWLYNRSMARPRRYLLPSTGETYTPTKIKSLSIEQQVEIMSHWFEAHYDDPNVLPYDSSEGGFQWIWGGPYDAGQQLRQEFDAFASDDAIAKLSSDLSDASSEWSGKPDEDDYDDEALSEWIASTDPYFALMTSQDNIEKTAKQKRTVRDGKILHRLLFVNVIASLEAYLGDALAKVLLAREDLLFSFYQDFERFRNVDPKPAGTAVTEEHMKTEVQRFLSWTVWHDMERTGKYYKAALGIQFPPDLHQIQAGVRDRHDIVHRNGKSMTGVSGTWGVAEIMQLKQAVISLASFIQDQINKIPATASLADVDDFVVDI